MAEPKMIRMFLWENKAEKEEQEMGEISFTAHISNKGSAINSKSKLAGVAKHNLRKYQSEEYSTNNIVILMGTENLLEDVRKIYKSEFDESLKVYNEKQVRQDRKIPDYFEHVCKKDQDIAVELIIQCGDKEYWINGRDRFLYEFHIEAVYNRILNELQKLLPNFKIANAVIHLDEASPHMHIVGVPIRQDCEKGLSKQVSKRAVFTKESLSIVLQNDLRDVATTCMSENFGEVMKEKSKGRNHDLSVLEYKVKQEKKNLEKIQVRKDTLEMNVADAEKRIKQIQAEQEEVTEKLNKAEQMTEIHQIVDSQLNKQLEEKQELVDALNDVEEYIDRYLPHSQEQEVYCKMVEQENRLNVKSWFEDITTSLGKILEGFKEFLQNGLVWFPKFMRWKTQIGDMAPVFTEDENGYELKYFRTIKEEQLYSIGSSRKVIKPENRVGTLEQIKNMIDGVQKVLAVFEEEIEEDEEVTYRR